MHAGMVYSAHNGYDNRSGLGTKYQAPVIQIANKMLRTIAGAKGAYVDPEKKLSAHPH